MVTGDVVIHEASGASWIIEKQTLDVFMSFHRKLADGEHLLIVLKSRHISISSHNVHSIEFIFN